MLLGEPLSLHSTMIVMILCRCGHCKQLEPIFEKVANELAHDSTIHIAKVDATQERELASRFNIKGEFFELRQQ